MIQIMRLAHSGMLLVEAFIGKNQIMTHGVARKPGRGVPDFVIQQEVKKNQESTVRGTTKAGVLEGDPKCPDIVAFSYYDSKPVNFVSTACTTLDWTEKSRKVFDVDAGAYVTMKFLHPNVTDEYNNGMNNVDQADQLRGTYCFDRWMRKWWWSIWMWGVQVLLTNAYVLYKSTHLLLWKTPRKNILSQYNFRKQVALAWLDEKSEAATRSLIDDTRKTRKFDSVSVSSSTTISETRRAPRFNEEALTHDWVH